MHALRFRTSSFLALALASAAPGIHAQVIRLKNVGGGTEIPLKPGSSVDIDATGNLVAECALTAASQCPGLNTSGPLPGAPSATLTRTDNDGALVVGDSVRLAWSSTGKVCEVSTSGPGSTGFTGVRPSAFAAGEVVTVGAQGGYTFSLVCYSAGGASAVSSVSVDVAAGGGGIGGGEQDCDVITDDPAFKPTNFARVEKNWAQVFSAPDGSPQASYPSGYGSTSIAGAQRGTYVVVPFVPNAGETVNLYWDQVQAQPLQGYPISRPADGMFFAISPCKGDLRTPKFGDGYPFLRAGCRKWSNSASLVWSTQLAASDEEGCKVTAGKTYFLHIMAADPAGGLLTGEHSCTDAPASTQGCDVQVKLSK